MWSLRLVLLPESSGIRTSAYLPVRPSARSYYISDHIFVRMDNLQEKLPTNLLSADGLFKVSIFLMHAPQFKDDIQLVSPDASWPTDVPPPILPLSIALLLSRICDFPYETIEKLWEILKDVIWNWAGRVQEINERYRQYGNELGYRVFRFRDTTTIRKKGKW